MPDGGCDDWSSDPVIELVLVTASLDATAQIYLLRPLAARLHAGSCRLHLLDGSDIAAASQLTTRLRRRHGDALGSRCLALFSRFAAPTAEPLLALFRGAGLRTAALLDDDLFDPPPDSALYALHADGAAQRWLRLLLDGVDILYVPAGALAQRLRERGVATPIFDPALVVGLSPVPAGPTAQPMRIGYMASRSHLTDLRLAVGGLAACLQRWPDLGLELFGAVSAARDWPELAPYRDRIAALPAVGDHETFLQALAARGWALGIAPLADTPFNRCKTAVKWLEYTACGVPVLASDMPVYAGLPGCGTVADGDWPEALANLVASSSARAALLDAATVALRRDYTPGRHAGELERFLALAGLADD